MMTPRQHCTMGPQMKPHIQSLWAFWGFSGKFVDTDFIKNEIKRKLVNIDPAMIGKIGVKLGRIPKKHIPEECQNTEGNFLTSSGCDPV